MTIEEAGTTRQSCLLARKWCVQPPREEHAGVAQNLATLSHPHFANKNLHQHVPTSAASARFQWRLRCESMCPGLSLEAQKGVQKKPSGDAAPFSRGGNSRSLALRPVRNANDSAWPETNRHHPLFTPAFQNKEADFDSQCPSHLFVQSLVAPVISRRR